MKNEMVCQGDMNLDRLRALLLECDYVFVSMVSGFERKQHGPKRVFAPAETDGKTPFRCFSGTVSQGDFLGHEYHPRGNLGSAAGNGER